ncbi:hypothetical protein CROQUDRAFT_268441 [Cronartium quercuum f. sp. fusiforme G11]|uniref:Uncharacterized protein n=1 Tax=Cronartium quercuum f. sp. fusiforme G11 TaxID=708437 RepID=A0A9P6T7E0_9BASI|nr:hypothetical protein CROQUDRAFT_268441 [Cronartium quercuum f. sp. fusiforme G11]
MFRHPDVTGFRRLRSWGQLLDTCNVLYKGLVSCFVTALLSFHSFHPSILFFFLYFFSSKSPSSHPHLIIPSPHRSLPSSLPPLVAPSLHCSLPSLLPPLITPSPCCFLP